jgi:hypothetical protein
MYHYFKVTNLDENVFLELNLTFGDLNHEHKILGPSAIANWLFGHDALNNWITPFLDTKDFTLEMVGYASDQSNDTMVTEVDLVLTGNAEVADDLMEALKVKLSAIKNDVLVHHFS